MSYLEALARELDRVGIHGRLRARILAETADHLTDGEVSRFGEPAVIAQRFADELATAQSRRLAGRAFAVLAVSGAGFAASWLLVPAAGGWPELGAGSFLPLGLATGLGMLLCPQIALAAGLLALLQARRLRGLRAAPAAEVALLSRRTATALACGAGALASEALFAADAHAQLAGWYVLSTLAAGVALTVPLAAVALGVARTSRLRPAVPGEAGTMFDDLPAALPRRPWAACLGLATLVGACAFVAGGIDEGPRNAVAEAVLVVACFAALGRRLGLR